MARTQLKELVAQFPENPLFASELGNSMFLLPRLSPQGPFSCGRITLSAPSARENGNEFSVAATLAVYLCYLIAKPFLSPIITAIVIAIVFFPLHARMHLLIRHRNAAAAFSTILVLLIVTVPALVLGVAFSREIRETYQLLSRQLVPQGAASPYSPYLIEGPLRAIGHYVDLSGFDTRATLLHWLQQASRYLLSIGAAALSSTVYLQLTGQE